MKIFSTPRPSSLLIRNSDHCYIWGEKGGEEKRRREERGDWVNVFRDRHTPISKRSYGSCSDTLTGSMHYLIR